MKNFGTNIVNLPNVLSISRIILSPMIFLIKDYKLVLFSFLIFIGITDILDGYISRKYKKQTIIGSWLDSISDFVFYIILVIFAIMFEFDTIVEIKYCVLTIIGIKILTFIIGIIKYKKLCFLHTIGNKITGIMIFIGFCVFILSRNTVLINIGLFVSILSSLEELIITIVGNKYEENIKGIWETNKLKKRGHIA